MDDFATRKLVDSIIKSVYSFEALSTVIHIQGHETQDDSFSRLMHELILIDEPGKKEELTDYYESHNVKLIL
jgi:hypothetical protein